MDACALTHRSAHHLWRQTRPNLPQPNTTIVRVSKPQRHPPSAHLPFAPPTRHVTRKAAGPTEQQVCVCDTTGPPEKFCISLHTLLFLHSSPTIASTNFFWGKNATRRDTQGRDRRHDKKQTTQPDRNYNYRQTTTLTP
ncbi:uncharacterized protein YALI1_F02701g [Yarrowia lipolytica]|uniref:Uncharacterized protein n=1 Tax=Yarrowia lipolytica TaxID=4952 RepID=A0A1D8NLJ3_YARLL|nr:hypothetical protein YALI1_F02701g [Yarrowia lipolytica]